MLKILENFITLVLVLLVLLHLPITWQKHTKKTMKPGKNWIIY